MESGFERYVHGRDYPVERIREKLESNSQERKMSKREEAKAVLLSSEEVGLSLEIVGKVRRYHADGVDRFV